MTERPSMSDPLLDSLAAAVAGAPDDAELRALYAKHLADAGRRDDAIGQAMVVLAKAPGHANAQALLAQLSGAAGPAGSAGRAGEGSAPASGFPAPSSVPSPPSPSSQPAPPVQPTVPEQSGAPTPPEASRPAHTSESGSRIVGYQPYGQGDGPIFAKDDVDWNRLEHEIGNETKPPFEFHETDDPDVVGVSLTEDGEAPVDVEKATGITLDDVGGLVQVKERIHETFLEPIAHPEIAKAFNQTVGGGLLLYGPPGCGKTFLARAIAGELGANFASVTIADVLSKWLGESEQQMHEVFRKARELTPAVLFFDEIDALGGKRSAGGSQHMRSVVNQLLTEMDGVGSENDGLFVLAATNMPWDVDSALLRPGRFDRMVLVLPPDEPAREVILRLNLEKRPIEGIDLLALVRATEGYSGADLKHLCDTASEKAMTASVKAKTVLPINMTHMKKALKEVKPSIGPWIDSARNVVHYGNADGRYDELAEYLKTVKRR